MGERRKVFDSKRTMTAWGLTVACMAVALVGCGSAEPDAQSASSPEEAAVTVHHFADAKGLSTYLADDWAGGCRRFLYLVEPGEAVHPTDEGMTPESLGLGRESFEMNDRVIEDAACYMDEPSTLGIMRFAGEGLTLAKYETWLEEEILPEACRAFSDGTGAIVELVWKSSGSIWNLEPSSRDFGDVVALPVDQRRDLLEQLAPQVGGHVVVHYC